MGLISKNKNKKQESDKNNTKQKQIQKNKAIVGVCSAGMKFCSRVEAFARLQNFITADHTPTIALFFCIYFGFVLFLLYSCFCLCFCQ